jgi:UDP-N-acetylglucosamine---dolichyl-phosphate N-acetylglucosaminyltransferase
MRKIALLPVYNEESTLLSVLDPISSIVDLVVVVDDGSTDSSAEVAAAWAKDRPAAMILRLPRNRGMSSALKEGFLCIERRLVARELDPEDLLLTFDADGQHDWREVDSLCDYVREHAFDVVLTRRDFALYPFHKRLGNRLMTAWGRIWSAFRYYDIESGFRAMRLKVIPDLLDYYTGRRYSCAQEIAVLTARLGFKVDNGFNTTIRYYRSQTSVRDVLINASLGFWAFTRWMLRRKTRVRPMSAMSGEHP